MWHLATPRNRLGFIGWSDRRGVSLLIVTTGILSSVKWGTWLWLHDPRWIRQMYYEILLRCDASYTYANDFVRIYGRTRTTVTVCLYCLDRVTLWRLVTKQTEYLAGYDMDVKMSYAFGKLNKNRCEKMTCLRLSAWPVNCAMYVYAALRFTSGKTDLHHMHLYAPLIDKRYQNIAKYLAELYYWLVAGWGPW